MKKVHKFIATLAVVLMLTVVSATGANAATPVFGHKYQYGVSNLTVWLNYASGVGYWEFAITAATNNWMYTGWANPIYFTYVSSNAGSNLDFWEEDDSYFDYPGVLAETKLFLWSGASVNPSTTDWYYAEVHINGDNYRDPNFSNSQAIGTTAHEIGHALGLAHYNSNPYSIMCQTGAGRAVQTVQKVDNDAVLILYP